MIIPTRCSICDAALPPATKRVIVEGVGEVEVLAEEAPPEGPPPFCLKCEKRYPPSLLKATCDSFMYALGLVTGEFIIFESAEIHGDFVTLRHSHDEDKGFPEWNLTVARDYAGPARANPDRMSFPRGVDVRVDLIAWCADAPCGS